MRTQPKAAAPLLENGEVARWFEANGWTYPVDGPAARGVAAVQQFFESMGLSKPPLVFASEEELQFTCLPQEVIRSQVTLRRRRRNGSTPTSIATALVTCHHARGQRPAAGGHRF